jgi:transcriptional regulator with XRE-family HTH domain
VTLADSVYARRSKLGLTQFELSHRSGINPKAISEIERAVVVCSISTLDKLAKALGCGASELIEP